MVRTLAALAAVVLVFSSQASCGGNVGQVLFDTKAFGPLGMDDVGRQIWCQTLNQAVSDTPDIRAYCEDLHKTTMVMSLKTAAPVQFGRLDIDELERAMRAPYISVLQRFNGLTLQGELSGARVEPPVPISEIASRLERLGVKTVGDFYAACGFHRFVVRNEENKGAFLELGFSNSACGSNPIRAR